MTDDTRPDGELHWSKCGSYEASAFGGSWCELNHNHEGPCRFPESAASAPSAGLVARPIRAILLEIADELERDKPYLSWQKNVHVYAQRIGALRVAADALDSQAQTLARLEREQAEAQAERIIYVVTSGSYSDYSICAVFDSRELAEAMVSGRTEGYDGYTIEEYVINPGEAQYRDGQRRWLVEMRRDGSVKSVKDLGWAWTDEPAEPHVQADIDWDIARSPSMLIVGFVLRRELWARSQDQAIKSTNELRAQWVAEGKWDADVVNVKRTLNYPIQDGAEEL